MFSCKVVIILSTFFLLGNTFYDPSPDSHENEVDDGNDHGYATGFIKGYNMGWKDGYEDSGCKGTITTERPDPYCEDRADRSQGRGYCERQKRLCNDRNEPEWRPWMRKNCKKTCRQCSSTSNTRCRSDYPVCGENGRDYRDECEAQRAGVRVKCNYECYHCRSTRWSRRRPYDSVMISAADDVPDGKEHNKRADDDVSDEKEHKSRSKESKKERKSKKSRSKKSPK